MKIFLWLIAIVASGAIGFYFGIGHGAKTLSAVVAQNQVTDGLADVRVSINALEKNDLENSKMLHEENLKSALVQIGTYSQGLAYWKCTEKDGEAIRAAHKYAEAHPGFLKDTMQQFEKQGLAFCTAKISG
jgi:hypothetical protein